MYRRVLRPLWGAYALGCVLLLGGATAALLGVVPGLNARRRLVHRAARLALAAAGVPLSSEGLDHLDGEPVVVVANHASYLDGIVMTAVLPPHFSFVIKAEIVRVPVVAFLLRRIGSHFIDRHNHARRLTHTKKLLRAAAAGESLVVFPEGTFRAERGLGPFRNGAFAVAARGGRPVVPVVIRGTRRMLPAGARLPRRVPLRVCVTAAIAAPASADAASETRRMVRARMLALLREPDLEGGGTRPAASAGD